MEKIEKIIRRGSNFKIPTIKEFKNKEVILFGASTTGGDTFDKMVESDIRVICFCDNDKNKWGKNLRGKKIISPAELKKYDKNTDIIISSCYPSEIVPQLQKMNFLNVYSFETIRPCFFADLFEEHYITESLGSILKLKDLLYDEKSRKVLENIIEYRLCLNPFLIQKIASKGVYFPPDIIKFNSEEVFVDAGAYTGDTVLDFIKVTDSKFKKIFSFEPDDNNYRVLVQTIKNNNLGDRVVPLIYGIYDKSTDAGFCKNAEKVFGPLSSKIDSQGTSKISTVSIDDYLKNEDVTFIKMDIEGAEIQALIGAKNTIIKNKPKLVICVYHKPCDLWEIPLLIKSFVPEYKIYLRHHSGYIAETVCYATI